MKQEVNTTTYDSTSLINNPPVDRAFCVPATPLISAWKNRLLVLPMAVAPLFYSRRLRAWKIKKIHNKMFTSVLAARREVYSDPESETRRAIK